MFSNMNGSVLLLSLSWLAFSCQALSTEEWQKQSIYSIMTDRYATTDDDAAETACALKTYCGGNWQGLIENLDYIQDMGFTAVWISPVVKNIEAVTDTGTAYHGYWTEDIWALNSHFGSEEDLKLLSDELHSRDMYLMVDVVVNHMAPTVSSSFPSGGFGGQINYTDYSNLQPFNSSKYYHEPCLIDNNSPTSVLRCRIFDAYVNLPDLRTEDSYVREVFQTWIKDLVTTYRIDGLRIDTAKHVEKDFFPDFLEAAGVFGLAEIFDGDFVNYPSWEPYVTGAFNYPVYYWLLRAFQSRAATMDELVWGLEQVKDLNFAFGNFLENHDTGRFAHFAGDLSLYKNALAFLMMMDGMPVIYQGQEQRYSGAGDPWNREALWSSGYDTDAELYQWISKLNNIRTTLLTEDEAYGSAKSSVIASGLKHIAVKKGEVITIATNNGVGAESAKLTLPKSVTGYSYSQRYVDVLSCKSYKTSGNGSLVLEIGSEPKIIYPASSLVACGWECEQEPEAEPTCVVNFRVNVTTEYGEMIKMSGNVEELGSYANTSFISLDPAEYPIWSQFVEFAPGTELEWTYWNDARAIHLGNLTEETGGQVHTYTVPDECKEILEVSSAWGESIQGPGLSLSASASVVVHG